MKNRLIPLGTVMHPLHHPGYRDQLIVHLEMELEGLISASPPFHLQRRAVFGDIHDQTAASGTGFRIILRLVEIPQREEACRNPRRGANRSAFLTPKHLIAVINAEMEILPVGEALDHAGLKEISRVFPPPEVDIEFSPAPAETRRQGIPRRYGDGEISRLIVHHLGSVHSGTPGPNPQLLPRHNAACTLQTRAVPGTSHLELGSVLEKLLENNGFRIAALPPGKPFIAADTTDGSIQLFNRTVETHRIGELGAPRRIPQQFDFRHGEPGIHPPGIEH